MTQAIEPFLAKLSDAKLLAQFASTHHDGPFAALVERHGPMVLGICRRILRNSPDADDAFQATFLLLAMKAGQIREPDLLGNWLFGVAARAAIGARRAESRRVVQEKRLMRFLGRRKHTLPDDLDLRMTLDEQINRLPDKLRRVVVCCYLQGLTKREAAARLKWAEGTVTSRLKEARELLKQRLTGMGLSINEETIGSTLAPVVVPAVLHAATVKAGAVVAAGKLAGGGAISTKAIAMAKGAGKAMFVAKVKLAATILVASTITVVGAAAITQSPAPPPQTQAVIPVPTASVWNSNKMDIIRRAVMSIQIYANDHGGSLPPDLKAVKLAGPYKYLGNSSVKVRMLKRPYAMAILAEIPTDPSAPIVIGYIDGHSTLLPARQAQDILAESKAFADAVKQAGDGPLPEAPGAPLPKVALPPAKASLPPDIRVALEANAASTNPIKLTWVRSASSALEQVGAMARFYVEPVFFARWTERAAFDAGKFYLWSDARNGTYETAVDGANSYYISRGMRVDFGTAPLRNTSDLNRYTCAFLDWAGLRGYMRASELAHAGQGHPLLKQIADGASIMAVEDATLEGRAVKRVSLVAENDRRGVRSLPETRDFAYYLDPQLGYAVRRIEERYGDKLIQQTDGQQFAQVPGRDLWLPHRIVRSEFTYRMIPDQYFPTPILTETLDLTEVSTAPLPPEQFVLKAPKDAEIINGRVISRPKPATQSGQAAAPVPAEDILAGHTSIPIVQDSSRLFGWIAGGAAIVVLSLLVFWMRFRKGSPAAKKYR